MTLANKITIGRIVLIPVFVGLAMAYASSVASGSASPLLRWVAVAVFAISAIGDAVDGYVARRMNEKTRLGSFLDPVADKTLMLAAIITLSVVDWGQQLPLWYALAIVTRDIVLVTGAILIGKTAGDIVVIHHISGKLATFLQLLAIAWVFFAIPLAPVWIIALCAVPPSFMAAVLYIHAGLAQLPNHYPKQHVRA